MILGFIISVRSAFFHVSHPFVLLCKRVKLVIILLPDHFIIWHISLLSMFEGKSVLYRRLLKEITVTPSTWNLMARINFDEKTINKKCHHFLGGMRFLDRSGKGAKGYWLGCLLISLRLLYYTIRLTIQENDKKIKHSWLVF